MMTLNALFRPNEKLQAEGDAKIELLFRISCRTTSLPTHPARMKVKRMETMSRG